MSRAAAAPLPSDTTALVVHLDPDDVAHDLVRIREQVGRLVVQGGRTLVVDASGVQRLSPATITALLWAQRRCRARGGAVVVRRPSAGVLELLMSTGLYGVIDVELGTEMDTELDTGQRGAGAVTNSEGSADE